jgi:hypothetical protein
MATAELEIHLSPVEAVAGAGYTVAMQFRPADSDADNVLSPGRVPLDPDGLLAMGGSGGPEVTRQFFSDPVVKENFKRCLYSAAGDLLRVQIFIDPAAPELHGVSWELLGDPRVEPWSEPFQFDQNVVFSRFLSSKDWGPVRLRRRDTLRVLTVVASPVDHAAWNLDEVDAGEELERVRRAIESANLEAMRRPGGGVRLVASDEVRGPDTLGQLDAGLRRGCDILYLVAHGRLQAADRTPLLYLEGAVSPGGAAGAGARGAVEVVTGPDFVRRIREQPPSRRPRLVVLASCQSAGAGEDAWSADRGALSALGPGLAEAGVPAVLAMQDNVTMGTVARLVPAFLIELMADGQIDRALAAARSGVRGRPDSWVPVLFLRVRGGRLWYEGFRGDAAHPGFDSWENLLDEIDMRRCTPVLGPGLLEDLVGDPHTIARDLALKSRFPLAPYGREDLCQVTQFLVGGGAEDTPRRQYRRYVIDRILSRYTSYLPAPFDKAQRHQLDSQVPALLDAVRGEIWKDDTTEPHRVLARLPCPVYLTTNPDDLLYNALSAVPGKSPHALVCPWRDISVESGPDAGASPGADADDPLDADADETNPLVYYLFGRLSADPTSPVLSEDDYLDYLLGISRNRSRIPPLVLRAQTDSLLMFLGFSIDHWSFRALFRSITRLTTGGRRNNHVAVQIDPEGERFLNPERARTFLEQTFRVNESSVSVYWGRAQDFLRELGERWDERVKAGGRP